MYERFKLHYVYRQLQSPLLCLFLVSSLPAISNAAQVDRETFMPDDFVVLTRRLSYNPDDLRAGDKLRSLCRKRNTVDRCIDVLNALTERHPKNKFLRYHAALAYVDQVPGHSLFKQGWLSTRSMNHVTSVIEQDATDWPAYYIRGLNGIYWPKSFRKLSGAIDDLETCIALSNAAPEGLRRPYHGLAYIALGDAYVKNGMVEDALRVYQIGAAIFDSEKLRYRLSLTHEELAVYVNDLRHTDRRVDTDISFLLDGGDNRI